MTSQRIWGLEKVPNAQPRPISSIICWILKDMVLLLVVKSRIKNMILDMSTYNGHWPTIDELMMLYRQLLTKLNLSFFKKSCRIKDTNPSVATQGNILSGKLCFNNFSMDMGTWKGTQCSTRTHIFHYLLNFEGYGVVISG